MVESYIYNLGQKFEEQVACNPSHVALRFTYTSSLNYVDLNALTNRIANYLIGQNVMANDVVAILNNKSANAYATMLACLKIGAIYTNLDPKSPVERFKRMLDICSPKQILYYDEVRDDIKVECDRNSNSTSYSNEKFEKKLSAFSSDLNFEMNIINGDTPAYIMFTSGSTGFPKGVVISHQNILNFINWSKQTYDIVDKDVFTNINPMHFDNSVFDFYSSLFTGASLVPIGEELTRNPRKLVEALNIVNPTIWFSVPSMLVFVLNMRALRDSDLPTLRVVTFGGEGFPKNQLRKLWKLWSSRVRFVNVYGPTECTCICSSYDVVEDDMKLDDLLPLGYMAPNFYGVVADINGKEQKEGETGELLIGGPNVGIGYYGDSKKTSEVFISNPNIEKYKKRVYRSGDLVKIDEKTKMFLFAGRKDNQIKRMGYRIELEEIENAFNSIDFISESAVVYVDNEKYSSKIIACLCAEKQEDDLVVNILKKYLPSYMLPDLFFYYDILPKNQNGKIDRLKLKEELNK
jgi:D-alanine--poly(phosphoribitol) ligase subunit 1